MDTMAKQPRLRVPDRHRRALEAAGWRTWLDYRENHRRDHDGRMVGVEQHWVAELEHVDGTVLAVEAASPAAAWSAARRQVFGRTG